MINRMNSTFASWAGLAALALFFASCGPTESTRSDGNAGIEMDTVGTDIADAHTSRNALDYEGTYRGVLPCADCAGIETELTLGAGGTFNLKTTYLGKDDDRVFEEEGTFNWDDAGQRITLAGRERPNRYFVGENYLAQLDAEGQRIEGGLADRYVLKK